MELKDTYTAWELCGDWWWTDKYYACVKNGRSVYIEATASNTQQSVILSRVEDGDITTFRIKLIKRYVHPDTKMVLVPYDTDLKLRGV